MRRPGSLFFALFLSLFALSAQAHELPAGHLAALGRIWGIVNYAHPQLGYRDVDLDAATISAIGRMRSSSEPATLSAAVDEMLSTLRDDATFVARPCAESALPAVDRTSKMLADGVVYLSATSPANLTLLRTARVAIVDLRPQPGRCSAPALAENVVPLLVRGSIPRANHRKVRHHGYRSQQGSDADAGFTSSFVTVDTGFENGAAETLTKVVFIVDERSIIPPVATALAASELASFVSVGRFPLHTAIDHCQIMLPDLSIVTLRTSELLDEDGFSAEPAPMVTLAANAIEADVIASALQLTKPRSSRRRASGVTAQRLADYRWRADKTYADMELPEVEYRVLAAYRLWNVIHFFYAHDELLGEWEMRLNDIVMMLEHVSTRRDYELALAEVMTWVPDAHSAVLADAHLALRGVASPPFRLMPVEGKPVVVETQTTTVKTGDQLLRIDSALVAARMEELARYTPAATELARQYYVARDLPNGAMGSESTFTFRRPNGTQYDVKLMRGEIGQSVPAKAWRILDGNIAYVDLSTLDVAQVPVLFSEVANTRAMIVDLRTTPRALQAGMLAHLRNDNDSITSIVRVPQLLGGAFLYTEVAQSIAEEAPQKYAGRTIVLVDERTQSEAENAALAFDAVSNAKFVGSATAGTNGSVSSLVLPGNIPVRFTASAVRHADGRQVQGVGLEPDTLVARTIRGLADGKDEVLLRAIALVDEP
ncbi:MAG TPA: S41 family peptidase [Thermoanaerobaculia bacterium]|jgi:C-terminal processing protease CtpA/Prc